MTFFREKLFLSVVVAGSLFSVSVVAQQSKPSAVKNNTKWIVSPFDNKVFVENKGQVNISDVSRDKVLYTVALGDVKMYFTAKGIIYNYDEYQKNTTDKLQKPVQHHLVTEWENASAAVTISAEQVQSYPYYYPAGNKGSIKASVSKKIIYHNLYPGIDVEYYFPENKQGFEYDVIVHPGADASVVKLKYDGVSTTQLDALGNVLLNTPVGEITDHAPAANYTDGGNVKVKFGLSGNEEFFKILGAYDKSKTLVIDPWTTDPTFTGSYDKAYDLDYDFNGNIYVYGAYNPFQLVKLSSTGVFQWVFNASSIDGAIYGGLAVDKNSGTSYLTEGAHVAGARILKVNTLGSLIATSPNDVNMNEMWRPLFNTCKGDLVIGAGGTNSNFQATVTDTLFTAFNNVNVLGASASGHSMVLSTIDPSGTSCYMAAAKSAVIDPANFNNVLVKLPLTTLAPTTYNVPDGYKFVELASIGYVGTGIGNTNGMNGMAASLNWLYLYDGGVLKRFNKTTGVLNDSVKVTSDPYAWGGLDADICDNVYAGSQTWISVYNSSMALADTINLPDTVYDVKIGPNRQVVYACGRGFVKAVNVPFSPLSIASANATCTCNGSATANLCGGSDTSNVTYSWSNGKTTQTITSLCGGKYKVTVTLGGCTPVNYFDSVTITQPPVLVATITSQANVKCNGGIGNATVTATGGAAPYTYSWSPTGGTNAAADTLPAGSYTVTVKDANNCTATATVTITQPTVLTDTATNIIAHCSKSDGTAISTVTGGTTAYTYAWAPGGQTNATANGLSAGFYAVTVTDANGCVAKSSTIIADSGVSPLISAVSGEKCFGQSIGTATIAMVNGTASFTYSWAPSGQTSPTATALPSATYTATVTDANGCVVTDTVTILTPNKLKVFMSSSNVSCHGGANGSIIANVFGGTMPYQYLWSPVSGTDSLLANVPTGTYSVTVTDTNGCVASDTITITQPVNGLMANIMMSTPVSCMGGKNGSATAGATGGTSPYSFGWSAPSTSDSSTADSLSAGTYVVTVTDSHGCMTTTTVVITQPSAVLSDTIISKNNLCDGDSNGAASVIIKGGTMPYTYTWVTGSTKDTISKLPSGTYTIAILDSNKCMASGSVTITQPVPLSIVVTTTPTPCNSNNGTALASVSGEPFTYSWSPGSNTSAKDSGLAAGSYTVTVTDTNGCTTKAVAIVPNSIPPSVTATSLPATCDSLNGSAIAHVVGGKGPYTYSWAPSGNTKDTATRIGSGIYIVTVTDANGCTGTATTIVSDSGVTAGFSGIKNVTCNGLANGSATATIVGGKGPYSYTWSPGAQTNATATNLGVGTYTVIITDSHNCTATDTLTITQPALLVATIPIANIQNVKCFGDSNGSVFPTVTGGTAPYKFSWTNGQKTDTAKGLIAGNDTVTVTDSNGCTASVGVVITQPAVLTVTASTTAATCGNNGSATATGHGGTSPYTYSWGTYGAGVTITAIGAGAYPVTATDANGCKDSTIATVIHSGQTANISASNNVKCFGENNGGATVSVVGGDTSLYGYIWSPGGQTNATATNLTAGIYTIVVTYIANGCTDTVKDTITQPSKLVVNVNDTVKCNAVNANVQVLASGGAPGYSYKWSSGLTGTSVGLPTGNYTVTVTDSHGCKDSALTSIVVPVLAANFKPTPDTILGGEYVSFVNQSAGETTWYWTLGDGNSSGNFNPYEQYAQAGTYWITLYVTNAKGCRDSIAKIIYVIENLYIPNVFTPNADGINDAFHITAGNMKEYDLMIYNRWGEKIFESHSPNIDWTGISDAGVEYPDGTYYYVLKATDYENKTYNKDGFVELIREGK